MHVCVCVCVCERERERGGGRERKERERERERVSEWLYTCAQSKGVCVRQITISPSNPTVLVVVA